MQSLLFIYNPHSGKGRIVSELSQVLDVFTKAGFLTTAYPTQCRADATRVVKELGAGYDRVVCAGGDGTLSETVAGLMALEERPVLGFIPVGSTNDCGATLRLPREIPEAAALAIGGGVARPWDIGKLNGRAFVYVAAFGAFTEVAYDTPQELKNAFGHMAYVMAGIASIPTITPYHLRVEYDGQIIEGDFFYGMVCNTLSVGGLKALPTDQVALDDGLFEVVLVKRPDNIFELGAGLQTLLRQTPVEGSALISFHASKLKFISDQPITWTVDGEYGGRSQVSELENCRKAITIYQGN